MRLEEAYDEELEEREMMPWVDKVKPRLAPDWIEAFKDWILSILHFIEPILPNTSFRIISHLLKFQPLTLNK